MKFGTFNYNQARAGVSEKQLYDELLEQLELTEELGFDAAWFAEHHMSDWSLLPSPNLIISALARRTKRMRLGNLVNILPLHDPIRLAEETAMLDLLTDGRLDFGVGRGAPREFLQFGLDRTAMQERFDEAVTIQERAWSEERFSYEGRFWRYQDVAVRPRPLQQPHPPIFYGAISPESVDMVARRGWHLALMRWPLDDVAERAARYRAARAAAGLPVESGQVILLREIHVADTDEQAWAQATPAMLRFWQIARDTRILPDQLRPEDLPALTSQLVQFRGGARVEDMDAWGVVLVGSPETVAARVQEIADTIAPTTLAGEFSFGSLTHEQVTRSIRLFAEEVIPRLRLDDRAVASGER